MQHICFTEVHVSISLEEINVSKKWSVTTSPSFANRHLVDKPGGCAGFSKGGKKRFPAFLSFLMMPAPSFWPGVIHCDLEELGKEAGSIRNSPFIVPAFCNLRWLPPH